MTNTVIYEDLGNIEYKAAWDYQESVMENLKELRESEKENEDYCGRILFCEHPHVYTLGKSGSENNLLMNMMQLKEKEISYYKTDRGGDITYHGPGQIVGYPVIDLKKNDYSLREYIYNLEEAIILTLKEYNIDSGRVEGATGIWIEGKTPKARKICAIGVRCSRWITMHGFGFNVNTDLDYFSYINPCGFTDKAVTSMEKELGKKQNMDEVKKSVLLNLSKVLKVSVTNKDGLILENYTSMINK